MAAVIQPLSALIDARVTGADGARLGEIRDVLVDGEGRVAYVALAFGGVLGGMLGVGEKLVALPWDALRVDPGDGGIHARISADDLADCDGFDKDCWPDCADARWSAAAAG